MKATGRQRWAITAGWIPAQGRGREPEFTSRDCLSVLNSGEEVANVRVTVVYATRDQVGPYRLAVAPRRMRQVRINDLIFPEAVRLEEAYGLAIESDQPVVVQFTRMDTRAKANAGLMTMAWSEPETSR
jgi:hypothetical protein